MPTGQQISDAALGTLGLLEQGGTPNASDSAFNVAELNRMWSAWAIDEGLIYAQIHERFSLQSDLSAYYTIGPSAVANFNAPIPVRIYGARFIVVLDGGGISAISIGDAGVGYTGGDTGTILGNSGAPATYLVNSVSGGSVSSLTISYAGTGYIAASGYGTQPGGAQPGSGTGLTINVNTVTATAGQNRNELNIVKADTYYAHRDLSAAALVPDELYPNYDPDADGFARLYCWPTPTVAVPCTLEIEASVNFQTWTLTVNQNIPASYMDGLNWALCFRLLAGYGTAVQPQIAQVVTQEAEKAELRIRTMNRKNRQLPEGAEMLENPQSQQQPKVA